MTPNQLIILLYAHTGTTIVDEPWARNARAKNVDQGYLADNIGAYFLTLKGQTLVDIVIRTAKGEEIALGYGKKPTPPEALTKQEYFRGQALAGLLANPQYNRQSLREDVEHFAREIL